MACRACGAGALCPAGQQGEGPAAWQPARLMRGFLVGLQGGGLVGQWVVAWWDCWSKALQTGQRVDGSPPALQCIVMWRSLSRAEGSGCQNFSSPWCFSSAKCVSSVSARILIPGAQSVCISVPVAILN
jgi:hypothetical protein